MTAPIPTPKTQQRAEKFSEPEAWEDQSETVSSEHDKTAVVINTQYL